MVIPQEYMPEVINNTMGTLLIGMREGFSVRDVEDLFDELGDNTSIESLAINECNMSDDAAERLAELLSDKPNITAVDLSVNDITDRGLRALMQAEHVRCLVISANQITDGVVNEVLHRDEVRVLVLDDNKISAENMARLSQHFKLDQLGDKSDEFTMSEDRLNQISIENALSVIPRLGSLPAQERQELKRRFEDAFAQLDASEQRHGHGIGLFAK